MDEIKDILEQLSIKLSKIDTGKYKISYKGLSDEKWENAPGLFRSNNFEKEKTSVEETERNFPEEFASARTVDILTQLQHYECPTRMMDVTTNFLVALFFACGGWEKVKTLDHYKEHLKIDGVVRIYKVKKEKVKSINSETVTVMANIARMKDGDKFGKLPWLCERDWGVWQSDDDQVVQNAADANSVVYVKTRLNNPRVRAQFGDFFLFGGLEGIEGVKDPKCLRECLIKKKKTVFPSEYVLGDICVPARNKVRILDALETFFGISYATMCPEKPDFVKVMMN